MVGEHCYLKNCRRSYCV